MYIQFINTLYKPHGSTNVTSKTTILYNISCYVCKTCAYWPSGIYEVYSVAALYVPRPLAPLKSLTLAVRQSHWPYVLRKECGLLISLVLRLSIW